MYVRGFFFEIKSAMKSDRELWWSLLLLVFSSVADGETNLVQAGGTIASIFAMSMKASKGKSVEA